MKKIGLIIISLFFVLGILGFYTSILGPKTVTEKNTATINVNQKLENLLKQNNANDQIAEAYRFAQENPQGVLSTVKCYCGCLRQGHHNNRDCFINDDGSFDLMGLNCGLCVKTALTAKQMLAEGKSVQEISDYVDNKWGKTN